MVYLNWTKRYEDKSDQLPDGLIAQLVEHCIVICARSKEYISVFDILFHQHDHKEQNWLWIFSRFLRWDFVKFGRLVVNTFYSSRSPFSREINLQKPKYCLYKPYFFRAENWYPAGGGEKFGTFPNKIQKFKKPQIKPQKKQKAHLFGHL